MMRITIKSYRLPSEVGSEVGAVPCVWPVLFFTPDGAFLPFIVPLVLAAAPAPVSTPLVPALPAPEVPPVPLMPVAVAALLSLLPAVPADGVSPVRSSSTPCPKALLSSLCGNRPSWTQGQGESAMCVMLMIGFS